VSADPLRINPENEGGGSVIGWLIEPCAAASIFRRCYHRCHWPFFVVVAVGVAVGSGGGIGRGGGKGKGGGGGDGGGESGDRGVAVKWRWW
jgi:hypothetical protein